MSSNKTLDKLLQELQSQAENVDDLRQVPEKPERLHLYKDLISVGSLVAVYGNFFTAKIRGEANVMTFSGNSPQWYKDYIDSVFQALTGPLAGHFDLSSMTNGHVSKKVDMTEAKQVDRRTYF